MRKRSIFVVILALVCAVGAYAQNGAGGSHRSNLDPVKVGEIAPDFTLSDENGKAVTLSELQKPVVLVFYRGYWCPFCVRQLTELRGLKQEGDNFLVYAISVDPAERNSQLRGKIAKDGKGNVNFTLLSDPGHKTIDAFGLHDPAYDGDRFDGIPHPAVYVLDKNRKVVWSKVEPDYRKRPSVDELRQAVSSVK